MTTLPFKLAVDPMPAPILLTVRGTLSAPNLDGGRQAHNQIAGSDQGVAAARSCGDLSHAVFVPVEAAKSGAGELLILDYWNSFEGLMQFFSNPQVQQGGSAMFNADRESVVWQSMPNLDALHLPAPTGRNERYVGLARGPVKSRDAATKLLGEINRRAVNTSRAKGLMSREWYFRATRPGEQPSLEAIGVDVWFDAAGMQAVYSDPAEMAAFGDLFTARPATSVWQKPLGSWVEW
jgi:hypothetical protein